MLGFILNAAAFPLNPHFLQKVFVARSDKVLKRSLMILCSGALIVNLPSSYYGLVRRSLAEDARCAFLDRFAREDAIGFHAFAPLEALAYV
jgi:hypothetical protein